MKQASNKTIATLVLILTSAGVLLGLSMGYIRNTAPDIQMQTATGEVIELHTRNAPTLVVFWATTCSACLKEQPELVKLYQELQPRGLMIIGVSMYYDPPVQVARLVAQRNIPYPIVMDVQKKVASAFKLRKMITPTTILVSSDNKIVFRKTGLLDMKALRDQIIALLPDTQKKG
ncbi:MAG TPA: TlpA family protein disulfide reductase [Gammaproteobacteria bacterium]|nr:TlpA family protein disulfide reductase [Gammaproteobacteria bacterium]